MPQSALPDLNTKFIIYTREAINGWKNRNYDSAIGSLYAFNGLLPDIEPGKYRVVVDDNEYKKKTKEQFLADCPYCKAKIDYEKIKINKIYFGLTSRLLSGQDYEKIWICPECKKENNMKETNFTHQHLPDPLFLHIVPKPPTRKDGIIDRSQFHSKFTVWFWTFIGELESQAARFRQDYKPRDEESEMLDIPQSSEEKDIIQI